MPSPDISLGPFLLQRPVQRGGMGAVWRGRHQRIPLPVAVKFILPDVAAAPGMLAAFRQEARVVAALSHPGVVRLLEHGALREPVAGMPAGSPYLVMPWADGGSLKDHLPVQSWATTAHLAETLLTALAHVHARGVLHRDLKPANVLCLDHRLHAVCLSDFGIARVRRPGSSPRDSAGTPRYMAPEQIEPALGPQGPWTDLYALGCLIWELVTGHTPYRGPLDAVLAAHLRGSLPHLVPCFPLPDGAEAWLRGLLCVSPGERPAFAADALASLAALGAAEAGPRRLASPSADEATMTAAETVDLSAAWEAPAAQPPTPPTAPAALDPDGWQRDSVDLIFSEVLRDHRLMRDAGLGLVGLQVPRFVGRSTERQALWEALAGVHRTGQPAVVLLTGEPGIGRSRLGRWLVEQAHAAGAAHVISHNASQGERLRARLAEALGCADHPVALTGAVSARGGEAGDLSALLGAPRGPIRDAGLRRLLAAVAVDRPVVLLIDDADRHSQDFCARLLITAEQAPIPALVVLIGKDLSVEGATGLRLTPLSLPQAHQLAAATLQLSPPLRDRLIATTGGHPGALIGMLEAMVRQERLQPGESGFELDGALETLREADTEAALRALDGPDSDTARALALAAVGAVGGRVARREWHAALVHAGLPRPDLEPIADAGLITLSAESLLISGPLRQALIASAARRADLHAAWAEALDEAEAPLRLGRHLSGAGQIDRAIDVLLAGTETMIDSSALSERCRELAPLTAGLPEDDPRYGEHRIAEMRAAYLLGMMERLEALAREALDRSRRHGWARAESIALSHLADVTRKNGMPGTDDLIAQALEAAERSGDARCRAMSLRIKGLHIVDQRVDLEAGIAILMEARVAATAAGLPHLSLWLQVMLAVVYGMQMRLDEAIALHREAAATARARGMVDIVADCSFDLGNLLMYRGDLEEARGCFVEAIRIYWQLGRRALVSLTSAQYGELLVKLGELTEARGPLGRAINEPTIVSRPTYLAQLHVVWAFLAARAGDRVLLREHLDAAEALVEHCGPETTTYIAYLPRMVKDEVLREKTARLAAAFRESWIRRSDRSASEEIERLAAMKDVFWKSWEARR